MLCGYTPGNLTYKNIPFKTTVRKTPHNDKCNYRNLLLPEDLFTGQSRRCGVSS